jgi:hypothetical protein
MQENVHDNVVGGLAKPARKFKQRGQLGLHCQHKTTGIQPSHAPTSQSLQMRWVLVRAREPHLMVFRSEAVVENQRANLNQHISVGGDGPSGLQDLF